MGAPSLVVVTRCSDREMHRDRIEGRRRDIPGRHELTWGEVAAARDQWEEPVDADLVLDTSSRPLSANGAILVDALGCR